MQRRRSHVCRRSQQCALVAPRTRALGSYAQPSFCHLSRPPVSMDSFPCLFWRSPRSRSSSVVSSTSLPPISFRALPRVRGVRLSCLALPIPSYRRVCRYCHPCVLLRSGRSGSSLRHISAGRRCPRDPWPRVSHRCVCLSCARVVPISSFCSCFSSSLPPCRHCVFLHPLLYQLLDVPSA